MVSVRRPRRSDVAFARRKRRSRLNASTTKARSAALPACSDGFDDVDGGPECRVYIQRRGIEQVRIVRAPERGGGTRAVALVASPDVGEHVGIGDGFARSRELGGAAAGAQFGACRD